MIITNSNIITIILSLLSWLLLQLLLLLLLTLLLLLLLLLHTVVLVMTTIINTFKSFHHIYLQTTQYNNYKHVLEIHAELTSSTLPGEAVHGGWTIHGWCWNRSWGTRRLQFAWNAIIVQGYTCTFCYWLCLHFCVCVCVCERVRERERERERERKSVNVHICVCVFVCVCVCMCAWVYLCMCVSMSKCVCRCICVCVCVCVYECVHVYLSACQKEREQRSSYWSSQPIILLKRSASLGGGTAAGVSAASPSLFTHVFFAESHTICQSPFVSIGLYVNP